MLSKCKLIFEFYIKIRFYYEKMDQNFMQLQNNANEIFHIFFYQIEFFIKPSKYRNLLVKKKISRMENFSPVGN